MASSTTNNNNNNNNNHNNKKYWNRETSQKEQYESSKPIIQNANIICISDVHDVHNSMLYTTNDDNNNNNNGWTSSSFLPKGSKVLCVGTTISDFNIEFLKQQKANVIFISHSNKSSRTILDTLLQSIPSIQWIHSRSAGIDSITSPILSSYTTSNNNSKKNIVVTNAKGSFSSTLAEYTMMAISYFAKDVPRLIQQKQNKHWSKYNVKEIRDSTLGIIGYGDIGYACATLAKVYGMNIIVQRRNPSLSKDDPLVDMVYGNGQESINTIMSSCDYILISAPLTNDTRGMINKEAFEHVNPNAVLINVGRGPIIDEDAMIEALKNGKLKGAALDVTAVEPLPMDNELWELDNVLLSPHNMDQTETFMAEATEFFVKENLPRFVRGEELLNPVDPAAGY